MELKPGYKQTEVGVIPEEWEAVAVGSLACFTSGCGISVAALCPQSSDYPVPVFGGNGIAGYTKRAIVCEPAVVVGRVGQRCGEVYLTDGPAWITDNALYPRAIRRELDVRFLAMALAAAGLNEVKNRNDLPLVTQTILHAVRIPWPRDMVEQRAIATALSDVDGLLGGLDRLIAKKRDLKQAAMQQLLTGQTRLPGFASASQKLKRTELGIIPEDWEVRTIRDMSNMVTVGFVGSMAHLFTKHGIPLLRGQNVLPGLIDLTDSKFISPQTHSLWKKSALRGGDLVIVRVGYPGTCAVVPDSFGQGNAASLVVVRPNSSFTDSNFICWALLSDIGRRQISAALVGGAQQVINIGTAASLMLPFPQKPEQTAIAEVLTEMDAELAALAQRREKTRALKQAMMQELLTGRTRLQGSPADLGNGHATAQEAHA